MFSPSQEKKEGVNTDIYPTVWTFSMRKKNTASVLLLRNEKCGEKEKPRSVLQQIQQKTKDLLCIRSCIYSSPHNSVTLSPPQGAPVAAWAQLPRVERGERYFVTHRGTTHLQSPSSFRAGFRKTVAQLLLGKQPCWSLTVMISILGVSEVQIPIPPSPPSPRAMSCPGVSQPAPKPTLGMRM